MIQWCAYCSRFIGSCEPFEVFQLTHGVCQACRPKVRTMTPKDLARLAPIRDFFTSLQARARTDTPVATQQLWDESRRLGIAPVDLMVGMLQPLLREIGELWAAGAFPLSTERQFTTVVQELLVLVQQELGTKPQPPALELLLANVEGNRHTMGLEMAELLLAPYQVPMRTLVRGVPVHELLKLIQLHRPKVLGFSLALPSQLGYVLLVAAQLKALADPPERLLIGGPALGLEVEGFPGFEACRQITDLPELLGWPATARGPG